MRLLALATSLFVLAAACGDDDGTMDTGVVDSGTDGDTDTGTPPEDSSMPDAETDTGTTDGSTEMAVTLQFAGKVADEDFSCGTTFSGLGTSAADAVGADFRFYVSNVRLVTSDDTEVPVTLDDDDMWQNGEVALLDFEDGSADCMSGTPMVNSEVTGMVATGDYTGVRFTVGIPFGMNHLDVSTAETPLNITGLFWTWQGGYKFIRIDLAVGSGGYNMHLGSTMCASGSATEPPTEECARPNRAEVSLDGFDLGTSVIVADLAELVADADITMNTMDTPPGCQSFPSDETDCLVVFPKLGLDYATGVPGSTDQTFFHLE
jgi:uncharacterized repeat protein (TIGR04052 family)